MRLVIVGFFLGAAACLLVLNEVNPLHDWLRVPQEKVFRSVTTSISKPSKPSNSPKPSDFELKQQKSADALLRRKSFKGDVIENIDGKECLRNCTSYSNYIITPHTRAGLNDRTSVIGHLANVARLLCAKLVIPPPFKFLNPMHERPGFQLGPDLHWKDLLNTNYENGVDFALESTPEEATKDGRDWIIAINDQMLEQFWTLYYSASQPFVWDMSRLGYYYFRWKMQVDAEFVRRHGAKMPQPNIYMHGCGSSYKGGSTSKTILQLGHDFSDEVERSMAHAPMRIGFHLRRDDPGHPECGTSLEKVERFLNCSLQSCPSGSIVAITTNNHEQDYATAVEKMVKRLDMQPIFVDEKIQEFLGKRIASGNLTKSFSSNFVVFAVGKVFGSKIEKNIELRRSGCPDCTRVC